MHMNGTSQAKNTRKNPKAHRWHRSKAYSISLSWLLKMKALIQSKREREPAFYFRIRRLSPRGFILIKEEQDGEAI